MITVKELIEFLQTQPQDKQVVLSHDDHTDWNYSTFLDPKNIEVREVYSDDESFAVEDEIDEDGNRKEEPTYLVINCVFW